MAQWDDSPPVKSIHTFLLFPFTGSSVNFNARKLQSWEPAPSNPTGCFTSSKQQTAGGQCGLRLCKKKKKAKQVPKPCFISSNFLFPSNIRIIFAHYLCYTAVFVHFLSLLSAELPQQPQFPALCLWSSCGAPDVDRQEP